MLRRNLRTRTPIVAGVGGGLTLIIIGIVAINAFGSPTSETSSRPTAQSAVSATNDFSAVNDRALAPAPRFVVDELREIHPEAVTAGARTIGPGMYISNYEGAVCAVFRPGSSGCTDRLDNGIWMFGDMIREYDSSSAPFKVVIYGLARDGISSIDVSISGRNTVSIPVVHNGFHKVLHDASFATIQGIKVTDSLGGTRTIDPAKYFPNLSSRRQNR